MLKDSVGQNPGIDKIMEIADSHSKWYEVDNQKGRLMMYDHQSIPDKRWRDVKVISLFVLIKKNILDRILPHDDYILGKFNVLKNSHEILNNQVPYYDFPHRNLR